MDFYQVGFDPGWFWVESTLGWVVFFAGLALGWVGLGQVGFWAKLILSFHWVDVWPDWQFQDGILTGLLWRHG